MPASDCEGQVKKKYPGSCPAAEAGRRRCLQTSAAGSRAEERGAAAWYCGEGGSQWLASKTVAGIAAAGVRAAAEIAVAGVQGSGGDCSGGRQGSSRDCSSGRHGTGCQRGRVHPGTGRVEFFGGEVWGRGGRRKLRKPRGQHLWKRLQQYGDSSHTGFQTAAPAAWNGAGRACRRWQLQRGQQLPFVGERSEMTAGASREV